MHIQGEMNTNYALMGPTSLSASAQRDAQINLGAQSIDQQITYGYGSIPIDTF